MGKIKISECIPKFWEVKIMIWNNLCFSHALIEIKNQYWIPSKLTLFPQHLTCEQHLAAKLNLHIHAQKLNTCMHIYKGEYSFTRNKATNTAWIQPLYIFCLMEDTQSSFKTFFFYGSLRSIYITDIFWSLHSWKDHKPSKFYSYFSETVYAILL